MGIKVLDPTLGAEGEAPHLAPPLPSLEGRTVGFIDNGKYNVAPFLDHVADILRSRYGVKGVMHRRKPDTSRPVPAEVLAELRAADAILSAVGD